MIVINSGRTFINSSSVKTVNTFEYNPLKLMYPDAVGCAPTESCASLLKITCLKLGSFFYAITGTAPICIRRAPSPSKQKISLSGLFIAIPSAIELAWPIEPTVKKSCPCAFLAS